MTTRDMDGSDVTVHNFHLLEAGCLGHLEFLPLLNPDNLKFPLITLPVGTPPVVQSLEQKVEAYVTELQNLPVHNFADGQKLISRQLQHHRLLNVETCIPETTLQVERNQTTGELLGYTEEIIPDCSETSRNSLSLRRAPDINSQRAYQDVRGSNINLPFWPGGLDEFTLQEQSSPSDSKTSAFDLEDESQYLTTPPGFQDGMVFEKFSEMEATKPKHVTSQDNSSPGIISLEEIMSGTDELDLGDSDGEEIEQSKQQETDQTVTSQITRSESLEKLVESNDATSSELPKRSSHVKEQWAVQVDVTAPVDDFHKRIPDMAYKWPFELDIFQKQAILHIENHDSVFVAAHTSAGKTVVAEYAIALSIKHMTRTIYTSPIKALSNQKFREFKDTFSDVGLVTGDVQLNATASCLIMTTEILRSMLYNGSDIIRDLEWVIFDEVHYINDSERGVVWEEVLIMLPKHVSVILLSATVPNCMEFADWVGKIKKKKIYVVSTLKRPVPLEHYLYTGNSIKTCNELFLLIDSKGSFLTTGYNKALEAKKERASKSSQSFGAKGTRSAPPNQEKNIWLSVIEMLKKKEILPAVAFTFSKKKIEEVSGNLNTVDLTTASEKSEIHVFFQKCISRLKGTDKELPQVLQLADLLKRGLGVHHSGILPILKEMVEMLFQRGLVKILFATETFAMGVNMPAKTVVFDSIRKHDGLNFRNLLPGEYIQMAGRAGRRGLDTTGTVILLCKGDVPESSELHKMMLGKPTSLESHFRLTYSMILNLLRAEQLRVQDMIKRSFSEFNNQKDTSKHIVSLEKLKKKIAAVKDIECYLCSLDLEKYYETCRDYLKLQKHLQSVIFSHPLAIKSLSPGRVVMVKRHLGQSVLGVVLSSSMGTSNERKFKTLIIAEKNEEMKLLSNEGIEPVLSSSLYLPEGPCSQIVAEITSHDISRITTKVIKVDAEDIIRDCSKREIPRFKDDAPDRSVTVVTQELVRLTEMNPSGLPGLHPINDLKLKDIELVEDCRALQFMEEEFSKFNCPNCPQFLEHFSEHNGNMKLKDEYKKILFLLSDESLQLLPEYTQRVEVLKRLECIDSKCTVQLKGKVACEMSTHEVMITELLFNNVLNDLHPADIAASLSCFVFEMKKCSEPQLSDTLLQSKKKILEIAEFIGTIQKQCGMLEPVQDYVEQYHFGLMEVVFEWARGMPFSEIIVLTDVHEGIIVRSIQRLHELLSDVRNAARMIGDRTLVQKMEETMHLIKRDIVFAASLYTQ
ncbi:SKI2 subunit of superkiller complex protein-like [Biomphalaria glabrata]|uniref:SKI2 subunit of superkiller complex protein-like n=1 Tax=Biomphalaria glabrata TaxID=6526 RepID=A0A9W3BB19_BIOGL|nr:SKI2 subunit of superkiller complex protein-like [Biomphalaria glabrata]XP_055896683.1 SKI2 subunit of superkiller complex protein-like [Biomphalaria glabrata]